jgi:outer membrane protein OmpA-like peptidoglycan-associated protein
VKKRFTGALQGIQFETGSAKIRTRSYPILDSAVDLLNEYPDIRVVIEGHTDAQGSDSKNLVLSEQRANSVRDYLLAKGIASDRMSTAGFGETKPVASNKTKAGREQNRRIEFRVIQD